MYERHNSITIYVALEHTFYIRVWCQWIPPSNGIEGYFFDQM